MNDLNRDARAFLAEAQGVHEPSLGAKERVRAGLIAALAVPVVPLAAGVVPTDGVPIPWRGRRWWLGAKVGAFAAIIGVGAAVLLLGRDAHEGRGPREVQRTPVRALAATGLGAPADARPAAGWAPSLTAGSGRNDLEQAAIPLVPVSSLAPAAPSAPLPLDSRALSAKTPAEKAARSASGRGAGSRHASSGGSGGSVAAEVAILRRVSASLRAGDPEAALVAVGEHARRFPNGALAEERDTERIVALCALGRRDEGARATERFDRAYPASSHAARIQAACAAPVSSESAP